MEFHVIRYEQQRDKDIQSLRDNVRANGAANDSDARNEEIVFIPRIDMAFQRPPRTELVTLLFLRLSPQDSSKRGFATRGKHMADTEQVS